MSITDKHKKRVSVALHDKWDKVAPHFQCTFHISTEGGKDIDRENEMSLFCLSQLTCKAMKLYSLKVAT